MLSNTFAGSTCHADRGGGPWARAPAGCCCAGCAGAGAGAAQRLLNTSVWSVPAAAFAAATWASAEELVACARALAVKSPNPRPDAAISPITYDFRCFMAGLRERGGNDGARRRWRSLPQTGGCISLQVVSASHQNARLLVRSAGKRERRFHMAKAKSPIPPGHHTVTPQLTLDNAAQALDWYKKALGAEEVARATGPDGKIMHAEVKIGDSLIMVNDPMGPHAKGPKAMGGSPVS